MDTAETTPVSTGAASGQTGATPSSVPAAAPQVFVDKDGKLLDGWKNYIPEDIRGDKIFDTYGDLNGMAKSLSFYHRRMREAGKATPDETAPKSEWETYYKLRGRPDNARDYKLTRPQDFPEGVWNDELAHNFEDFAFSQGLTGKEVKAINEWNNGMVMKMLEQQKQAEAQAEIAAQEDAERLILEREGAAFEPRKHIIDKLITDNTKEGEERNALLEILNTPAYRPAVFHFLADVGSRFMEGGTITDFETTTRMTPETAESKAKQMQANPEYLSGTMKQNNPEGYKEYQKTIDDLYKMVK